jgi:hypothetical protein
MLTKKKKIIILVGMVGLLVVTGWLNIMLNNWTNNKNTDSPTGGGQLNFFEQFRVDRIATRDQTRMHLETIVNNPASTPEAIASALAQIEDLARTFNQELALETMIKGLGFSDAIVTNSTVNLNVIVQAQELTSKQANQILNIITTETDTPATDVRLMTV